MRPLRLAAFWWIGSLAGLAWAETPLPIPILAERLTWVSPPTLPALQSAWVLGTESTDGLVPPPREADSGGPNPAPLSPGRAHDDGAVRYALRGFR